MCGQLWIVIWQIILQTSKLCLIIVSELDKCFIGGGSDVPVSSELSNIYISVIWHRFSFWEQLSAVYDQNGVKILMLAICEDIFAILGPLQTIGIPVPLSHLIPVEEVQSFDLIGVSRKLVKNWLPKWVKCEAITNCDIIKSLKSTYFGVWGL